MSDNNITLIGYSGHAYVCIESIIAGGGGIIGYCEVNEKNDNPYKLTYLGREKALSDIGPYFISIGDNILRSKVRKNMLDKTGSYITVVDPTAMVSPSAYLGLGVFVSKGVIINAQARIEEGAICNSGSIIEHDCQINAFAHIAPGAILLGNVKVGEKTLIGANAVIKEGVKIGSNVIVGAGSVVLEDVDDNAVVVGHPARLLKYRD